MSRQALLGLDPESQGLSDQLSRDVRLIDELLFDLLSHHEGDGFVEIVRRLYSESAVRPPTGLFSRFPEL